ncbi:MAG: NMCC_0638 family (lipo)protein [Burkholderiales bacterium]
MIRSLLSAVALACASASAQAQQDSMPEDPRAVYALNLFGSACVSHIGDRDATSAWAGLEQLPPIEKDQLSMLLQGKSGHGWNASGPNGDALLILREDGTCSVWARRAPAAQVGLWVRKMMEQAAKGGSRAELMEEREIDGRGGRYRVVAYRLSSAQSERQFLLTSTLTEADSEEVTAQVILSIGEIAPR